MSSVGLDAPDLVADPFAVSYGRSQPVAVTAKRSLHNLRHRYSVNGGPTARPGWSRSGRGGERYGDTHDDYYAEFRGKVRRHEAR